MTRSQHRGNKPMNHVDRRTRSARIFTVGVGGLGEQTERRVVVRGIDLASQIFSLAACGPHHAGARCNVGTSSRRTGRTSSLTGFHLERTRMPPTRPRGSQSRRTIFRSDWWIGQVTVQLGLADCASRCSLVARSTAPPIFGSLSAEMEGEGHRRGARGLLRSLNLLSFHDLRPIDALAIFGHAPCSMRLHTVLLPAPLWRVIVRLGLHLIAICLLAAAISARINDPDFPDAGGRRG